MVAVMVADWSDAADRAHLPQAYRDLPWERQILHRSISHGGSIPGRSSPPLQR
jgi:hypothetical protein